ncbi:uncharacterized protein [Anoplolepis gracilipes]|uniref:uncharacterized protein n=1 Tax=Anoplolepis gracilipes TaxID=354296 RepID=UPI003B9FB3B4
MAGQNQNGDIDQLSETVKTLQKSLECTICLQLMTEPTKTRCGHSFCKSCIGKVLRKKNASCPLCKKNLNRRNVSKDDHLEACIIKFTNLITAIQLDSNIDILLHSKPRDTRESYSSEVHHSFPADENDNAIFSRSDVKVRTWLHHLPDELSFAENTANLIFDNDNKKDAIDEIHDNKDDKSNKTSRFKKQIMDDINVGAGTSRASKDTRAKQFDEVIKTNFGRADELKYKTIHARVRTRAFKENASKSDIEKTNNQNNSSLTTGNDQTCQILTINDSISNTTSTSALQSSSADWSRMIEFGKETKRGKKRKMKKLNVSIEKTKDLPRIIKNVTLSPSKKYNLAKIATGNDMNKKEKNSTQDAIDENLDLSNAKVIGSEVSSKAGSHNRKESTKNKTNSSTLSPTNHSLTETYDVMQEEENKQMYIENLNSNQVNEIIIGSENINKNSRVSQNWSCEENTEIAVEYCDSPKRLTVLTPEKLNESVHGIIHDMHTPASKCGNTSPPETRTPEAKNNSIQRISGEVASSKSSQSPLSKARLSLKRNPEIGDNKKTDSPLLSIVPLIDKLPIIKTDKDDCENVDSPVSKNEKPFDRLTAIRRDLNLELIGENQRHITWDTILNDGLPKRTTGENVSRIICQDEKFNHPTTSKQSENIKNQTCSVKFLQIGTMIRRRNVKYFYSSTIKREQSIPAQVQITPVCNMQQSISKSEIEHIANMSCNLARSIDESNESQDILDITVIENIHPLTKAVLKNIELSTAVSPRKGLLTTSTPKKEDIDHHLNKKKIATTEENVQSLCKTPRTNSSAIREISRVRSGTSNSIKLLSPDKDSQLKFLAIDSPMSNHGESRRANSKPQQTELEKSVNKGNNFSKVKNSQFEESMSKAQEPSVENFDKKRKRMRYTSDKELLDDDRIDYSNDSASDNGRRGIKLDRYSRSSKNAESGLDANSKQQQTELEKSVTKGNNFSKVKNSQFAESTSKAQEPSVENFDKKRKKMRYTSDKEFDDDRTDYSNDSASDNGRRGINFDRYSRSSKNAESGLDANKKHRPNSPDDQNIIEIISSDSEKQDTHTRKFKRILPISSSDTESDSTEHVARNCKRPRADGQFNQRNASIMVTPEKKCLLIKNSSEEKWTNYRSGNLANLPMRESDMFESSSIFNSENVDYILQQSKFNKRQISEEIAEASNDDIINRVLQINRLQSNTDACRPLDSAPRNSGTSQREKNSREYLLQDNFDEIIANVELPQSNEDTISCSNQPTNRNLKSRPLAKQKTSSCLAMTDEPGGAAYETPMLSTSSTNDIFDHYSPKNVKRLMTIATLENVGKENVFHGQKKHNCSVDQREKRNVMVDPDTIERDPCRKISKYNVSHEREKFFEESSPLEQRINVSTDRAHDDGTIQKPIVAGEESNLTTDTLFDSLMNVTQHQVQLQKFEEELFGIPANQSQKRTTKITLQEDPTQEKQHTPEKRKKDTQDKEAAAEVLSADEDDVVEKTPERKIKNNRNNMKLLESRKNMSSLSPISKPHLSPAEQIPSISKKSTDSKSSTSTPVNLFCGVLPLYQSTPQSSTTNKPKNVREQSDKRKLCFICSGLTVTRLTNVKEFARKYNVDYVNQFESGVTHVIVNTVGEKNAAKSTLKFLQGIAHRKWIVSYRWIEDCIEQGKLLDEIPYEATTFTDGNIDDGPRRSRLRKKDLFEDFTFWCVGPYLNVSPNQYQSLLLATGATVVDSLEALAKKEGMKGILIQDGVHDDKEIEHWNRTAKAASISDSWIVDCIGNYKLFNLATYIHPHLSVQDLCAIGFPQELVEDEEYSDDEE